jgi:hypothetical protein
MEEIYSSTDAEFGFILAFSYASKNIVQYLTVILQELLKVESYNYICLTVVSIFMQISQVLFSKPTNSEDFCDKILLQALYHIFKYGMVFAFH